MSSFEELGLSAGLVEAMAAEGIETPSPIQEHAIPVLRRGTSAVLRGSPGSGLLAAYGSALLDRIEPTGGQPRALVLTGTAAEARGLATSMARLALVSGHRVAALGSAWAHPERAHVLFAPLDDLDLAVRSARLKLEEVQALVLADGTRLLQGTSADRIVSLLQALPDEVQIAIVAEPVTVEVRSFVDRHVRRAVFLPPEASAGESPQAPIQRGSLVVHTIEGERDEMVARIAGELLEAGSSHVVVFTRSEDAAADLGDALTLRGFLAGAPGDLDSPVWLGTDPMEVRGVRSDVDVESVAVVSVDVPADADELDRRHGGWKGGAVALARPRELPHLQRVAREAGYMLDFEAATTQEEPAEVKEFLARVAGSLDRADLGAYLVLLEPLLRRHGSAAVAAALAALVRGSTAEVQPEGAGSAAARAGSQAVGGRPPAWVKLFMSIGSRDGVGPGDLLGAITGETGIAGDQVGRIDVRDTFSRVDIQDEVADAVIRRLNGTSIRGRSVRVDFDRGESRAPAPESGPKGGRGRDGGGRRDEGRQKGRRKS
ncbi:MAG: DbpA RNA binding domain-containing protein [Gemmatimonadota bacterium]